MNREQQMLIDDTIEVGGTDYAIIIASSGSDHLLHISLPAYNITKVDDTFTNLRTLSAVLVCEIGLGPCIQLLEKHNVPRVNPIWDLNHSGLWKP